MATTPEGYEYRRLVRRPVAIPVRFLTWSCRHDLPLFRNDAIKDAFVKHLMHVRQQGHIRLFAFVVMTTHVHLLLALVRQEHPRHTMTRIKGPFARKVIQRWRELDATILDKITDTEGTMFWQPGGGYDRSVESSDASSEMIAYIHNNPVKAGLVSTPEDWTWSSAAWAARGVRLDPLG